MAIRSIFMTAPTQIYNHIWEAHFLFLLIAKNKRMVVGALRVVDI